MYDDPEPVEKKSYTADEYYMLSLNSIHNEVTVDKSICEKHVDIPENSWTFYKPREKNCDLNFKGANNKYITLYFNEKWLQTNLMNSTLFVESGFDRFIQSDDRFIIWSIPDKHEVLKNFQLFDKVMNLDGSSKNIDFLNLKYCTLNLIFEFFKQCKE